MHAIHSRFKDTKRSCNTLYNIHQNNILQLDCSQKTNTLQPEPQNITPQVADCSEECQNVRNRARIACDKLIGSLKSKCHDKCNLAYITCQNGCSN